MAISDKLQDLIDIKQDIKTAIENKDVDLTGVDFGVYAVKIDLLPAVVELTQAQYDAFPATFKLVWGQASPITLFVWNDTGTKINVFNGNGIADLSAPYNTISGSHIFATESEIASSYTTSGGIKALVTGHKWSPSNSSEYNTAGYKIDKSGNFFGNIVEGDANYLVIPCDDLWDYGQASVVLRIEDIGSGNSYWKLTRVDKTFSGSPKVYESIAGVPPVVDYNPIGISCSIEGKKMIASGTDTGMPSDCYELTCYSKETTYDDNTYYLIVEA